MESISVRVLDLYLDSKNPRHEPISDRQKIIEHLVKTEKIKALAKDISDKGISPLDLPAIIKDGKGNFVVVEGNGRICALTLLNDPELCPEGDKTYFKQLSEKSKNVPEELICVLFDTREEANVWIELRHNGEQGGVGLVTWDATQKARFFDSSDNTLALKLIDYAQERKIITAAQRQTKILTTISRFVGNPIFRSVLGVTTGRSDPNVKLDVPREDFDKVLKKFFDDLFAGVNNVTSRSKKDDWERYAKKLKTEGYAPNSHVDEYDLLEKTSKQSSPQKPPQSQIDGSINNPSPDSRKYIIPYDFKVVIKDKIIKRAYDELRTLNCDEYTLASALVCRAFLENVYGRFYEKTYGNHPNGMQTHSVLDKVIKKLEENKDEFTKIESNALGALRRVQNNENNVLSPKTLGAFAHASWYPDSKALKREWDNISAVVAILLKNI
ncbi:hypothetical protein [Pantoea sp. Fr+CA_20]|uniref:hypothetical protein n=1 Tax=Pantoea sp. Fr+CA_20 TaxID=2929506 RepID=UPI002119B129|nr:hypothetical protein [Pantoea sp. Fr+CA_20]